MKRREQHDTKKQPKPFPVTWLISNDDKSKVIVASRACNVKFWIQISRGEIFVGKRKQRFHEKMPNYWKIECVITNSHWIAVVHIFIKYKWHFAEFSGKRYVICKRRILSTMLYDLFEEKWDKSKTVARYIHKWPHISIHLYQITYYVRCI